MYQASMCRVPGTTLNTPCVVPQQERPHLLSGLYSRTSFSCNSRTAVCRSGTSNSESDIPDNTTTHNHRSRPLGPGSRGRDSSKRPLPPSADKNRQDRQPRRQQPQRSKQTTPGATAAGNRPGLPAHVVQAMRRTKAIQSTETPQQLLALLQRDAADMNHINLSAAYTLAAKLCRRGLSPQRQPAAVQQLHQLAEQLQQQCDARALANIIWACGQLRYAITVKLLLPSFKQHSTLQQAKPQEVSNILWALATLQVTDSVVQQLVQHFVGVLPSAKPQEVSNTLWAVATLEVQLPQGVVQQLVQHFIGMLPQANPQAVSNTLWAVATLEVQLAESLLQQLVQHLIQTLPQAKPQAVSNTLWAVATLNVQPLDGVVQQLVRHLIHVLPQVKPQDVSNTLWAAATLKVHLSQGLVQQLVQHLVQVLPQAKPQDIAITLWAASTLEVQLSEGLMQQLLQRFANMLPQAKPQDVSNSLWACGQMQYAPLQLLSALQEQPPQLDALLAAAKPQAVANMAWACGQLGYRGKLLPGLLLQQAGQLLQDSNKGDCSMQNLCNLCWSAAVLDLQQCVPQVLQLAAACKDLWATAADEGLLQLYQVHLWLLDSQLPQPGEGLTGVLSQHQLQQCEDSWQQQLAEDTASVNTSHLQQSVFTTLQALPGDTWQQAPVSEQLSADGALSIDIAATTVSGVQLAIEVEGPNHYVQPNRTYDGSTLFRNRALAARGYVLVSIPYWEWNAVRGTEQQQQYLLTRLQAASEAAAAGSGQPISP